MFTVLILDHEGPFSKEFKNFHDTLVHISTHYHNICALIRWLETSEDPCPSRFLCIYKKNSEGKYETIFDKNIHSIKDLMIIIDKEFGTHYLSVSKKREREFDEFGTGYERENFSSMVCDN